jgi:addiction module RelB/DinJ family antitoxin
MNTHTILNIKTDKKLKASAKEVASELGVPLSTVINAFLKQFVREKEITLSVNQHRPTPYLEQILETAQEDYNKEEVRTFKNSDALLEYLGKL